MGMAAFIRRFLKRFKPKKKYNSDGRKLDKVKEMDKWRDDQPLLQADYVSHRWTVLVFMNRNKKDVDPEIEEPCRPERAMSDTRYRSHTSDRSSRGRWRDPNPDRYHDPEKCTMCRRHMESSKRVRPHRGDHVYPPYGYNQPAEGYNRLDEETADSRQQVETIAMAMRREQKRKERENLKTVSLRSGDEHLDLREQQSDTRNRHTSEVVLEKLPESLDDCSLESETATKNPPKAKQPTSTALKPERIQVTNEMALPVSQGNTTQNKGASHFSETKTKELPNVVTSRGKQSQNRRELAEDKEFDRIAVRGTELKKQSVSTTADEIEIRDRTTDREDPSSRLSIRGDNDINGKLKQKQNKQSKVVVKWKSKMTKWRRKKPGVNRRVYGDLDTQSLDQENETRLYARKQSSKQRRKKMVKRLRKAVGHALVGFGEAGVLLSHHSMPGPIVESRMSTCGRYMVINGRPYPANMGHVYSRY